jgi:hypothetical protein
VAMNERLGIDHQTSTIRDVARLAGVSTATVSRALNEEYRVSPETKAIVEDAAHRLEYRPNVEATKLGRRNSGIPRKRALTPMSQIKSRITRFSSLG